MDFNGKAYLCLTITHLLQRSSKYSFPVSDSIKHECGIGLVRLLKPLDHYQETYNTALWGFHKAYLLMEKMRNRGQDGAGLGCIKTNAMPGRPFHHRERSNATNPLTTVYNNIMHDLADLKRTHHDIPHDARFLKQHFGFAGEAYIGHLRYGTQGNYSINAVHPVVRTSNYINRCLMLAGNFNLTNVDRLFKKLVELGQHPRHLTDTETMLERICHFLDKENNRMEKKFKKAGYTLDEITQLIANDLDIHRIIERSANIWDGGYVMGGIIGNGDAFIARDPNGIRPCFYYYNDEVFVAASERPAISTVFNVHPKEIKELKAGHIVSVKAVSSKISEKQFIEPEEKVSCSFERIYFSRGGDADIYKERKALGANIFPKVLDSVDHDLRHTVFSFIPNTAELSFLGLVEAAEAYLNKRKVEQITKLGPEPDVKKLERIIKQHIRAEKVVHKDVKMRTFIADDTSRDDLVSLVYDITHGVIEPGVDNLVCIDDSIVRGTTLKKSILQILSRLKPKKIVIVSSAPQIRYPDCYGIDMSHIHKLISFQAAIALLEDRNMGHIIEEVHREIVAMKAEGSLHSKNIVKRIYEPFTEDEVSAKITEILTPEGLECELEILFQPLAKLPEAIPDHRGDWYFSGNYPTPGGNRIVNLSFLNYYEGKSERAYHFDVV